MDKRQILNAVRELSYSQGYYGRLYRLLTEGGEEGEELLEEMAAQNFSDILDMIMWLEQ